LFAMAILIRAPRLMIKDKQCDNNDSTWIRYLTMNCSIINQKLIHLTQHKNYGYFKRLTAWYMWELLTS